MSKLEQIKENFVFHRKRKHHLPVALYSTLIGAIEKKSKNLNPVRDLTDDEIIAEIKSMMKGVKETMDALRARDMMDEFHNASQEWIILNGLLPVQMTEEEIFKFARRCVGDGAENVGQIMNRFKAEKLGLYDGKTASVAAKEALENKGNT